MIRLLLLWAMSTALLFGFQKGAAVPNSLVKQLGLHKDKTYIIDFFASWCVSCRREMPQLSRLNRRLDKSKYQIIGIDVDEDPAKGKRFQRELRAKGKLNFRVRNDPKGRIIKRFGPVGMPALYVIKNNHIKAVILGAKSNIAKLLMRKIKG